ncbi:arsenate reductase/protein-tyrosine-phosphatase family protein, partial [Klebsiella pneumoniae]
SAEFTIGEGELMAHDVPLGCAPDEYDDLISGTCSHLPKEYELILVMEKNHIEQISNIAPEARGKTMLFGHWLEQRDIPDPYRKSEEAFASVFKLIEQSALLWAEKLKA